MEDLHTSQPHQHWCNFMSNHHSLKKKKVNICMYVRSVRLGGHLGATHRCFGARGRLGRHGGGVQERSPQQALSASRIIIISTKLCIRCTVSIVEVQTYFCSCETSCGCGCINLTNVRHSSKSLMGRLLLVTYPLQYL